MDMDNQELEETKRLNGSIDYKKRIEKEIKQLKLYINELGKHIDTERYEYALHVLEEIIKE